MTRVQRLGGQLKFGELDEISIYRNETTGELVLVGDGSVALILALVEAAKDSSIDLQSKGFFQTYTVRLINNDGDPRTIGTLVDVGGADDSFSISGVNSTAIIGVVKDATIPAGVEGQIAVAGVCDINLDNAATLGQYVASTGAGLGTSQIALPAAGRTVGRNIETSGGAGLARCILGRM